MQVHPRTRNKKMGGLTLSAEWTPGGRVWCIVYSDKYDDD